MIYRGKVTALASTGVYVTVTDLHPTQAFGPLKYAGAKPAVADIVLVAVVGADETLPDMVVISPVGDSGSITNDMISASAAISRSKISGLPTSSADNEIIRADGTGGGMQTSGAKITDDGSIYLTSVTDSVRVQLDTDDSTTGSGSSLYLNTTTPASSHFAQIMFRVGGKNRWNIFRNRDAESSGDAGSNLEIGRYADDGSTRTIVLHLTRSSGRVRLVSVGQDGGLEFASGGPRIMSGANTPEAAVTAPIGSLWLRTNGGAGTTLYVKESGTGNTGWVAK